jgi:23S rRNA (guanine2445-N2)-methyltransferase / 23S rRNA (guanine2069-N7)-methyltransferase
VKTRKRQKGDDQYEKQDEQGAFEPVHEAGHTFLVNLSDYIDTGLFLDHRPTRALIGELAKGRRFLNLFSYTATATVHAARGGAPESISVDLSNTYSDWAERNFEANQLDLRRHHIERADVLRWLDDASDERFDLIFLDPPTFSTSKSMEDTLDIQRDHIPLLRRASALLSPGGILVFSTNFRRFRLDVDGLPELAIDDITARTIPEDFARNPRIHQTYRITRRT